MPKGVPAAGFRMTKNRIAAIKNGETPVLPIKKDIPEELIHRFKEVVEEQEVVSKETDEEIAARLKERFDILEYLTNAALQGDARALIVSGPAGLGKSFTVEKALKEWDQEGINHEFVKGYVRATGLLRLLYKYREPGQVIVFDDADNIFYDDTTLNMLKAVCDTTDRRMVSYRAETNMRDEDTQDLIPTHFEFEGTIIFITNIDFDTLISRGHKLAPHLQALVSRSHYIDLSMKTKRDYLVRINQVVKDGMLKDIGLNKSEEEEVMKFIQDNSEKLRELSLRIAVKIGNLRRLGGNWDRIARVTCCKV